MGEDIKNDLAGIAITHPFFADMATNALNYIEELEKENKSIKEANEYWTNRYCEINNESIPKSKVIEKIEDLKQNNNGDDYNLTNVIMILQELLREE